MMMSGGASAGRPRPASKCEQAVHQPELPVTLQGSQLQVELSPV
jgi:hypothetical protein